MLTTETVTTCVRCGKSLRDGEKFKPCTKINTPSGFRFICKGGCRFC